MSRQDISEEKTKNGYIEIDNLIYPYKELVDKVLIEEEYAKNLVGVYIVYTTSIFDKQIVPNVVFVYKSPSRINSFLEFQQYLHMLLAKEMRAFVPMDSKNSYESYLSYIIKDDLKGAVTSKVLHGDFINEEILDSFNNLVYGNILYEKDNFLTNIASKLDTKKIKKSDEVKLLLKIQGKKSELDE